MKALPIASSADRGRWLNLRRFYVTASDAWMMVCESRDGEDLWAKLVSQKSGAEEGTVDEDSARMRWGRVLEPAVVAQLNAELELLTGHDYCVTPFQLLVEDPECRFLAATPDCLVWNHPRYPGVPVPLDLKIGAYDWSVTKAMKAEAEKAGVDVESLSPVREYAQVQLQVQMACLAAPAGMIARLAPGKGEDGFGMQLKHWTFERHDALIDTLRTNANELMRQVREQGGEA